MDECARMGCDKPAVALLTFAPQQAKAWLYDLVEPDPSGGIVLCRKHANGTVVPMSWQLIDARDPAWPGPASERPTADVPHEPSAAERATVGLPSDSTAHDREFAALREGLPVTPQPYAEPQVATLRAAGVMTEGLDSRAGDREDADMSLFQLPLSDEPAVTPHPDYR